MKTLTLRDVVGNGGVPTDEQLEPFVVGDSKEEREVSQTNLRRSVVGHMRSLDGVDPVTRAAGLDDPIISLEEPKAKSSGGKRKGK